jgi:nucleoside-diphosphate-sugar epimerase
VTSQGDGDLGERLARASGEALAAGVRRVVVIGSDCPGLEARHLAAAFDALQEQDVVIGPAADGGYYLIGLRGPAPSLFENIAWGTSRVAAQTLATAARQTLRVRQLEVLGDVDRPEDLALVPPVLRPRRIALTGATGSLGMRFLERMLRDVPGLEVAALVRRASPSFRAQSFQRLLARYGQQITLIDADLRSLCLSGGARHALATTDGGLWHFAAATSLQVGSESTDRELWAVNDGGTASILDVLHACEQPGPLFHISTAYVCGASTRTAREDDAGAPASFRNGYEASKCHAEQRVRAAFAVGLKGCIFRPSVIVGDHSTGCPFKVVDRLGDAVVAAARGGGPPLLLRLPPDAAINVVHLDWVVESLIHLAARAAAGVTYHLTARRPLRISQLARDCRLRLDPAADPRTASPASRALGRALSPLRPYLTTPIDFDRTHFEHDAPELARVPDFDASVVLRYRLSSGAAEVA